MKQIVLPFKELRLLANQLQSFNQGYTVKEIRSLDNVSKVIENALKDFNKGLSAILISDASYKDEKEHETNEQAKQQRLQEFLETEGAKPATVTFDPEDLLFIKTIWGKMTNLSGIKEAREAVIKIDNALNG